MNRYISNKGFTLIELLSVMVILAAVSLIAVGGISASLEKREEREKEEQKELAIGAAKIYFSLNDVTCVKIQDLIDNNYFSDDDMVSSLYTYYVIRLVSKNGDYVYEYVNDRC